MLVAASIGAVEDRDLAAKLHAELLTRGLTVSSAESLTGGAVADLLSATPGASDTYVGGVVSYATRVKQQLLEVSDATVAGPGVVSAECAAQMASGVRDLLGADYAVSTTGVAGPDAQEGKPVGRVYVGVAGPDRQEDKPVGLVYLGVAGPAGVSTVELRLTGDRARIRAATCREAVLAVLDAVVGGAV